MEVQKKKLRANKETLRIYTKKCENKMEKTCKEEWMQKLRKIKQEISTINAETGKNGAPFSYRLWCSCQFVRFASEVMACAGSSGGVNGGGGGGRGKLTCRKAETGRGKEDKYPPKRHSTPQETWWSAGDLVVLWSAHDNRGTGKMPGFWQKQVINHVSSP